MPCNVTHMCFCSCCSLLRGGCQLPAYGLPLAYGCFIWASLYFSFKFEPTFKYQKGSHEILDVWLCLKNGSSGDVWCRLLFQVATRHSRAPARLSRCSLLLNCDPFSYFHYLRGFLRLSFKLLLGDTDSAKDKKTQALPSEAYYLIMEATHKYLTN